MTGFIQSVFDILVRGEIIVLDGYWSYCVRVGHCAAPLVLRYSVPAAGTAAAFAMLVGWSDVRSLYGVVLAGGDEVYRDLVALVEHLKQHRWDHGINAQYYGADTRRLDMSPYQSMAATIEGVYEAYASASTLLQSKSMHREASGAPLQKGMARISAKAMRTICVKAITQRAILDQPKNA